MVHSFYVDYENGVGRRGTHKLACTMAASVAQRIAFGERAGQKVRRISSEFGSEGEVVS